MKKLNLTFAFLALFVFSLTSKSWANCPTPNNLQAFDITTNTAVLTWEAGRDAYKFAVKIVNGPNTPAFGISVVTDAPQLEVRGLEPGGAYLFIVKAWCMESLQDSDYSDWAVFRTPDDGSGSCAPPADQKAIDVTPFSAKLLWTAVEAAEKYELEFQKEEQTAFNIILRETSFSIDRLSPQTKYRFRVRSFCNGGADASEFSGWYAFLTPTIGSLRIQPGTDNPASAYPNPADQNLNLSVPALPDGQLAVLRAFNAQGQLYLETSLSTYKGQVQPVSVADLPNGMYFLVIESNGQQLMEQKVVVSHR